ncbi:hypothetical protein SPRG_16140 [Saprolegnia parasitica CBS 223.65]|uniref:Serine-threonine/tyrosine-protein kinase catalytic domain-containing protein n=1 Tax=Saprolegnia parasitica (strain CBS 223.65) TaxID=695850 RepID=A0A067BIP6_SAPPC|nr:hypothetical protein SPRG_16140 [Saprolegnia parasitica CBS 223.65]KDO18259.1 hypothetical protein SPRG_16140 [Saprolegnia parasitica CBS 223.65]|eukprot:XP_012211035.1 hypothetical protein SPRG_16140 [Saprolegnia parasitica CBS 223.65]
MDTLQLPFHDAKGLGYWGIIDGVRLGNLRPTVSANCPPWLRDLADACLSFDPTQRPSAQMIVESLQKVLYRSEELSVLIVQEPTTKLAEPRAVSSPVCIMSTKSPEPVIKPPASDMPIDADKASTVDALASSMAPLASTGTATESSTSMLVSTQFMCQLCFASNSLLQTHCESCTEELASTLTKLQVVLKRVAVAKKKELKINDGLVCICCDAQQSMEATACSECNEALPNDQSKLSILLRRIEKMTKATT